MQVKSILDSEPYHMSDIVPSTERWAEMGLDKGRKRHFKKDRMGNNIPGRRGLCAITEAGSGNHKQLNVARLQ